MAIKYVLHPGFITSRTDGDRHYIGDAQLARLYGVPMSECIKHGVLPGFNGIDLHPQYDGDYSLPGAKP
jgi:hypothetical protein